MTDTDLSHTGDTLSKADNVMRREPSLGGRIAGTILGLLLCLLPAPLLAQDAAHTVPFLTVRDLGSPNGPSPYFGDARSTLRAGHCILSTRDTGSFSNILENGPTFIREQLLRIEEVDVRAPDDMLSQMQSGTPDGLVLYVHGYFIDFDKGCRRAALLQKNASLQGRMVWFSWPSDGDIVNYPQDEADLYWSVPDLADAIIDLANRAETAGSVDVLGHSLGGRGLALALQEVARRAPDTRLGHVVLLAADMDFGIFRRVLPSIRPIATSITVYVSNEDRPLSVSAQLHGYQRLGQAGNDVASLEGVEVIDVSGVPNESASGHLYHIHLTQVGRDLSRLLSDDMRAAQRPHLRQLGANRWGLLDE